MNALYLIPARGGSKGIPHKNIKALNGRPLLYYAIDSARSMADDIDICVSTDDPAIKDVAESYGLYTPFLRPEELATDECGSQEVILHAIGFYEQKRNRKYDTVVLLQPTSPFRRKEDIEKCIEKYNEMNYEMVVSVVEARTNPFYNCYIEKNELLYPIIEKQDVHRRQDAQKVYEYNGAVYVINTKALRSKPMSKFGRVGFYEMDELHSLDLDTMMDWRFAENLLQSEVLDN